MSKDSDYVFEDISEKNWIENDGWGVELVDQILKRLRRANPSISKELEIIVVRSKEINAFAVTGNYIYVSRSLLEKCGTEETAAFVIAHELAHHELGHLEILPRWVREGIEKRPSVFALPFVVVCVIFHYIRTSFTPRVECDADLAGLNFCMNAGYDPAKCIAAFDILESSALNRRQFRTTFGPKDDCDDELNENASLWTKFNIWLYYLSTRSLPIRDRREFLLQNLESRGIPREKRRRVAQKI